MTDRLTEYRILIYAPSGERLEEDREALVAVTWEAGHYARPLGSPPGLLDGKLIEESIAATDVLVVLCRHLATGVRMACECAATNQKPILAFALDPLDQTGGDSTEDFGALESIVHRGARGSFMQPVSQRERLRSDYLIRLDRLVRVMDKSGSAAKVQDEMHVPNPFVRKFAQLAQQWQVLNARCEQNADLKRSVAAFILDLYFTRLVGAGVTRWFLESGSSIAYLAESLTANWPRLCSKIEEIETNNILTYLELISAESVRRFSLYPSGRPEDKYGATFGSLRSLTPPVKPASMGHPIEREARFETDRIRNHFSEQYAQNGIIFAATSGIELDPQSPFQGPHVGSYYNMLFKRAELEAGREKEGIPVVILADESKVRCKFEPDKCFPICDRELSWKTVCEEVPLAIACAFRSEKMKDGILSRLQDAGFTHKEVEREGQVPWCTIVSNDRFWAIRSRWIRASARTDDDYYEERETDPEAVEVVRAVERTM